MSHVFMSGNCYNEPMIFGTANIKLWELGIPAATGYREHLYQIVNGKIVFPSVNGPIPQVWPVLPAGKVGFYTLYPNPDELLAGKLDGKLRTFLGSAPPQGGVLTAYAEADADPGKGGQFAALGLSKAKLAAVHHHMKGLCAGTRVRYGNVVCGTAMNQVSFCVPGMDFYGLDWYDTWSPQLFLALNQWRINTSKIQRSPVLAISETNSNVISHRPEWFSGIFGWLAGYGLENGGRALGYWSYWRTDAGVGSLSGPWLPGDTATVDTFTWLAGEAQTFSVT